jgi:hypothetical protein
MAAPRARPRYAAAIFASFFVLLAAAPFPARASSSARAPITVDACDACAASASAFHDALEHTRASLRARYGAEVTLGDAPDSTAAAEVAVEAACGPRGRWLRYELKSVGVGDASGGGLAFLALSGPGLDAENIPGITRPDGEEGKVMLSRHLRERCLAEADRIGLDHLIAAFEATSQTSVVYGQTVYGDDPTEHGAEGAEGADDAASAFAARVCVEGEDIFFRFLQKVPDPPCPKERTAAKARALVAAADDARALDERSMNGLNDPTKVRESVARCEKHAVVLEEKMSASVDARASDDDGVVIIGEPDAALGLEPAEMSAARTCASLARALIARGRSTVAADTKDVTWVNAIADYASAARAWPRLEPEAMYSTARAHARFDHAGGFASTDPESNKTVGIDRYGRLEEAKGSATKAVMLDKTDPDARLTMADISALMRDDAHAMEQYMYAIGLLQLYGERPAAAATSRAAAASAVANQFATYLGQMERFESLAVNNSEHNQTILAKMRETKAEAEKLGKKRALEASEDMLTALMQRPTRRRHVGMAAAAVVYSAWTQSPVDVAAAEAGPAVSTECDDDRPPVGCYGVMLNHARNMMELELWELARQAAHYAVRAKGEKWKKKKDAAELAAEAERKMEAARGRSRSTFDPTAGKHWRQKMEDQLGAAGGHNLHTAIHRDLLDGDKDEL